MSNEKQKRRSAAGPAMDPAAISYQMSPVPGAPPGPGNMNGNPENLKLGLQVSSMNPEGSENLYRDAGGINYPQMGSEILNPLNVPRSQLQQNTPVVMKGNNAGQPFGLQQQPSSDMADNLEGMRLGAEAQQKGLFASPHMGMIGSEALMPGAMPNDMPGTSGMFLQPMTSMNPMTPGSSPKKTGKNKGKK